MIRFFCISILNAGSEILMIRTAIIVAIADIINASPMNCAINLFFACTQHFSYTNFFCSFFTACSSKIHKIDAGNQENNPCNYRKQSYLCYSAATCWFAICKFIIQMPSETSDIKMFCFFDLQLCDE